MSAAADSSPTTPIVFPNCVAPDRSKGAKAVLSAFGLQDHEAVIAKALANTDAFIAGSSALYWYLNNISETPIAIPEGSDMDIWLPVCPPSDGISRVDCKPMYLALGYFECLLTPLGYKPQSEEERYKEVQARRRLELKGEITDEIRYHLSPSLRFIKSIHNFINTDLNRKIQIIVTEQRPGIRKEILNSFDFDICSMCVQAYRSKSPRLNVVFDPAFVPQLGKPIPNTFHLGDVNKFSFLTVPLRLEKYYARGFVMELEKACTACGCDCKAAPVKLTLDEAKAYVKVKMEEQLAMKKATKIACST